MKTHSNEKQWSVRGMRGSESVRRTVSAPDRSSAVLAASKGRGFMLVRECVLLTDAAADRAKAMKATCTKIQDAQPLGEYTPTQVDAEKKAADFRLLDVSTSNKLIRWRDGRAEYVTSRQLAKLQAAHSWATDF